MEQRQSTGRRLRLNHSTAIPRYIIAVDTETLPTQDQSSKNRKSHRLRLGVAVSARICDMKATGKKTHRFKTGKEFWDLVAKMSGPNFTTWIVAHSALFDMVVASMPEEFESAKLSIDWPRTHRNTSTESGNKAARKPFVCIESPPTIIAARVASSQGRIVIVDTLNWFQCPLSELGTACGLPKKRMPEFSAPDEHWFNYCERDTEIVFETFLSLIRWVRDNDMGMFRYTGPSQAIAAFRHKYMNHEILVHDNLPIKVVERAAYFGGRFECFRIGPIAETIHQYDVNALFPSVMRDNVFPSMLDRFDLATKWTAGTPPVDAPRSIAEVELDNHKAVFPYRTDKGVVYPVGKFRTALCGPELEAAIDSGCVTAYRAWSEYKVEPIFRDWVDGLWSMRTKYKQEGNKLYERFSKMLMNSLYGKFGQRAPEWETVYGHYDALPWMTWIVYNSAAGIKDHYRSFGWTVQKKSDREIRHHPDMPVDDWEYHANTLSEGELCTTFVAISAFVTAYARQSMNMLRAISGPAHTFYQGVDSLIVTNEGRKALENAGCVHSVELGKMRLQLTADHGEIFGCSDYRVGDKVVIAGLSRPTTLAEQQSATQRTMSAKANLFRGYAASHVTEENLPWKRTQEFWKGTVDQDGTVSPLVFPGM